MDLERTKWSLRVTALRVRSRVVGVAVYAVAALLALGAYNIVVTPVLETPSWAPYRALYEAYVFVPSEGGIQYLSPPLDAVAVTLGGEPAVLVDTMPGLVHAMDVAVLGAAGLVAVWLYR